MKKISIILPTYNVARFILRCLNSLSMQLKDSIEILIIDDESPDDSIQIAQIFSKNIPLRIIHQKNRGLGGARNTGIQAALGEYIWFVDPDDEIEHGAISRILGNLHGQDVAVFSYVMVDALGKIKEPKHHTNKICDTNGANLDKFEPVSQAWRSVYRRDFLIENKIFFKEKYLHEDGEFNMRVMCLAESASYEPYVIYKYYTQNSGSIMNDIKIKHQRDLLLEFETAQAIKKDHPNLSLEQLSVIHRHLDIALSVLFLNVLKLPSNDLGAYRKLLREYQTRIWQEYKKHEQTVKRKIIIWLFLHFPYRVTSNLIYNKRLW